MKTKKNAATWQAEEKRIRATARKAFEVLGLPEPANLHEFLELCDVCVERLVTEAMSLAAMREEMATVLKHIERQRTQPKGQSAVH